MTPTKGCQLCRTPQIVLRHGRLQAVVPWHLNAGRPCDGSRAPAIDLSVSQVSPSPPLAENQVNPA